jgi:hypothetical protein
MPTQCSVDETRPVRLLAVIMATLVLACTGMTVLFLYRTPIESQQRWLPQVADSQAQLIKAAYHTRDGDRGKVFRIVKETQATYQFRNFRHTGEVILFREVGDQISDRAGPARRALVSDGNASTYVGPGRLGNRVIAGYIALPELGWSPRSTSGRWPRPSSGPLSGRRVLLVEDNPVNRAAVATMLN